MRVHTLLLLVIPAVMATTVTEVLPDPEGSDNEKEFVEVDTPNLTGMTVGDSASNDSLVRIRNGTNGYALIVEEGASFSTNATVYSAGAAIGNGLGNSGDSVFLYRNGTVVDSVNYSETVEGKSINLYQGSHINGDPTPGYAYTPTCNASLSITLQQDVARSRTTVPYRYQVDGVKNVTIRQYITSEDGRTVEVSNVSEPEQTVTAVETNEPTRMQIHGEIIDPACNASATETFVVQESRGECSEYKERIDKMSDRIAEMQYLMAEQPRVEYVQQESPNIEVSQVENTSETVTYHAEGNGSIRAYSVRESASGSFVSFPRRPGNHTYIFLLRNETDMFDAAIRRLEFKEDNATPLRNATANSTNVSEQELPFPTSTNATHGAVVYEQEGDDDSLFAGSLVGAVTLTLLGAWRTAQQVF